MSIVPAYADRPAASRQERGQGRFAVLVLVMVALLAALALTALLLGTPRLGLGELREILFTEGGRRVPRLLVWELRLPRLLLGALAGMALGTAGTLLQDALKNPLAGPELLGVSAGAAVLVALIVVFHLPLPLPLQPPVALAGGLIAGAVVLGAMRGSKSVVRVILLGAALTALLNALLLSIISLGETQDVASLYQYLLGNLGGRTWVHLRLVAPWLLLGLPLAALCARPLNLLQLGDELAEGLGLPVLRTRALILLLAAILVAGVVAVCGPIGYVALLAPHLARRLLATTDARLVLPLAALLGAVLLVMADLAARLAFAPIELPVGIWTTAIGGPVLLLLLRQQLRGGRR